MWQELQRQWLQILQRQIATYGPELQSEHRQVRIFPFVACTMTKTWPEHWLAISSLIPSMLISFQFVCCQELEIIMRILSHTTFCHRSGGCRTMRKSRKAAVIRDISWYSSAEAEGMESPGASSIAMQGKRPGCPWECRRKSRVETLKWERRQWSCLGVKEEKNEERKKMDVIVDDGWKTKDVWDASP